MQMCFCNVQVFSQSSAWPDLHRLGGYIIEVCSRSYEVELCSMLTTGLSSQEIIEGLIRYCSGQESSDSTAVGIHLQPYRCHLLVSPPTSSLVSPDITSIFPSHHRSASLTSLRTPEFQNVRNIAFYIRRGPPPRLSSSCCFVFFSFLIWRQCNETKTHRVSNRKIKHQSEWHWFYIWFNWTLMSCDVPFILEVMLPLK